ncbi:MAG: hypothetical protein Kow0056_05710 [Coriobacteriia bacterium]
MKEFAVFWGCTIPARFPFIEKATRLVFEDLGAVAHDLEGFTCCPEGVLVKSNDEDVFYTTAARNLAVVEASGDGLVTPCNGCYSTFKETQSHLRTDWRKKDEINERLSRVGLHYEGDTVVRHLAEWLIEDMGPGLVASRAERPLWGMTLSVHYGCHLLRPQPAVRWDDPLHPTKVEGLLTALGAKVVEYPSKMDCCGQALDRVGEREGALAFARRKLHDVQNAEADALVVVCPSCFQQFDLNQAALQRAKEDINMPVFYLAELIALAYGHEPDEIGLSGHRVSVEPFLEKWVARKADREALSANFDVSLLAKCYSCQACKDDCPVCKVDPAFEPTEMIARLLQGEMEQVIAEGQAWKCLECFTCQELCHSDIGMAQTFRTLKELAARSDRGPDSVAGAYSEFLGKGVLGKPRESARRKLGLEPLPENGADSLAAVLEEGDEE